MISIVFTSCSSNDKNIASNDNGILLKKIISTSGSSTNSIQYTYIGNKLDKIYFNNNLFIQHTYSGNLIVNVKQYSSQNDLVIESFYTYDSNDRVIKEKNIYYLSSFEETKVYTYNSDNTVAFVVLDQSLSPTGSTGTVFLNSNSEVYKIEYFNQGNFQNRYEIVNDDKNNPLKNIVGFDKLPPTYSQNHNNLLTKNTNNFGVVTTKSEYVYSYKSNNYVNTFDQSFYNNNLLQSVTHSQYIYE
jgi:hypothetical protein